MGNHLKALLKKQYIVWKRNKCCSCMEVLLPVLVVAFMFVFRASVERTELSAKSYLTNPKYTGFLYP